MATKKKPRKVYKFSKANWGSIKKDVLEFQEQYMKDHPDRTVEENWQAIKQQLNQIIDKYVPSKMTHSRINLPWVSREIKRMCKRKHRLYRKAKKSKRESDWNIFKKHKKATVDALRRAHWQYVHDILADGLAENNTRPFWRYVKSQRQDSVGIAPLKEGNSMHVSAKDKSEALSRQFSSVFTVDNENEEPPSLMGPGYPPH